MAKIIHFRENCIGCNSCVEHSPAYWEMDETDGKARLKGSHQKGEAYVLDVSEVELEDNKGAAADCAVSIIRLVDDQGKEINPYEKKASR